MCKERAERLEAQSFKDCFLLGFTFSYQSNKYSNKWYNTIIDDLTFNQPQTFLLGWFLAGAEIRRRKSVTYSQHHECVSAFFPFAAGAIQRAEGAGEEAGRRVEPAGGKAALGGQSRLRENGFWSTQDEGNGGKVSAMFVTLNLYLTPGIPASFWLD